jgi:hypothetical protein
MNQRITYKGQVYQLRPVPSNSCVAGNQRCAFFHTTGGCTLGEEHKGNGDCFEPGIWKPVILSMPAIARKIDAQRDEIGQSTLPYLPEK